LKQTSYETNAGYYWSIHPYHSKYDFP
jgi:hypothetical protein